MLSEEESSVTVESRLSRMELVSPPGGLGLGQLLIQIGDLLHCVVDGRHSGDNVIINAFLDCGQVRTHGVERVGHGVGPRKRVPTAPSIPKDC